MTKTPINETSPRAFARSASRVLTIALALPLALALSACGDDDDSAETTEATTTTAAPTTTEAMGMETINPGMLTVGSPPAQPSSRSSRLRVPVESQPSRPWAMAALALRKVVLPG